MIRWFQSWLRQRVVETGHTGAPKASEGNKVILLDVAHEVLSKEAAQQKESLKGLERFGWPFLRRQKKKEMIKTKVKNALNLPLTQEDGEEMIEEITEKIAEVCEQDPRVRNLFKTQD